MIPTSLEKAMYVASPLDRAWLQTVRRNLYCQSQAKTDFVFRKLWGFVTDERNLRCALARVASNHGSRTGGVDGITVRTLLAKVGTTAFVGQVRADLRSGSYHPMPVRRVLIPKRGQPGKYRPLGIPTVTDRVVQAALKNILEPIFEADFYPSSYGFRPGRSAHAALEHLKLLMRPLKQRMPETDTPRLPYQWAIEGDIKSCFDRIDHHGLMQRVRLRVADSKVNRLIVRFLKAGIMTKEQFNRSHTGTPQGGILSPLLANIALGVLDERYERHVWPRKGRQGFLSDPAKILLRATGNRHTDRVSERVVCFPVRYADDFIVLLSVPNGSETNEKGQCIPEEEKREIGQLLKDKLGLELSAEKTLITPTTGILKFLGHNVRVGQHLGQPVSSTQIPKERSMELRRMVRRVLNRSTANDTLANRLRILNPLLRGWTYFYRHANGAKKVFAALDDFLWWRVLHWLREKHRGLSIPNCREVMESVLRVRCRSIGVRIQTSFSP